MDSKVIVGRNRSIYWMLLLLLVLPAGCTDGGSPSDLPVTRAAAQFSLSPGLLASLASEEAPEIVQIRAVATIFGEPTVVGSWQGPINPTASSWPVTVDVTIPPGEEPLVEVTVELLSAGLATEWSGHVGPLAVLPGQTTTAPTVTVVRGPLDNLSVTAVSVSGPSTLRVGKTATLQGTATSAAPGATPVIYWSSLDPEVGTISQAGVFQAVAPGTARITAVAGPAQGSTTIQVLPALASVVITPDQASADALGETLAFAAVVLDTGGNPAAGETVTWTVDAPEVLENLGSGSFRTVGEGTATVTATSTSEPALFATAGATVKQVPKRVEIAPASATVQALGETQQFAAEAFDANDNPLASAAFQWSSSNTGVATVSGAGLATATGGGSAEIKAEVLEAGTGTPTGVYATATFSVELPLSVFISPTEANLGVGVSGDFFAWAEDQTGSSPPGITFTWTSSDPEVAIVMPKSEIPDGHQATVTAMAPGTATITVSAAGVSASAEVTVNQVAVALRWVQQPPTGYLNQTLTPAPSVEAIDAFGNRVESFEGNVSLQATYLGFEPTSPLASPPALGPGGPELNVSGVTTVKALLGLATFNSIFMIGSDGFYTLTALANNSLGVLMLVTSLYFEIYYSP